MRLFFRSLLWLSLAALLGLALLVWAGLSPRPLVAPGAPPKAADLQRARRLLAQHRQSDAEGRHAVTLDARDLEIAANLLLRQRFEGAVRTRIAGDTLRAQASLRLPLPLPRPWLNLQLELRDQDRRPNLLHLQVGELRVPQPLARWLLGRLLAGLYASPRYRLAQTLIDDIRLQDGRLLLSYRWTPELAERTRAALQGADADQAAYLERLRRQLAERGPQPDLARLLQPLFALAAQRGRQGDPVEENRRLLALLGAWADPGRGARLLGLPRGTGLPRFRARLHGRIDLARHFLISAMLAAHGSADVAQLAGEYKEISDADGGSGFSFVDLMADRAGARLGTLAVASPASARRLQQRLAAGVSETELMPEARHLREGLDLARFRRDYRHLGAPAYRRVVETIDRRIARSPLYASP